jgi:hypothetical protein
MVYGNLEIDRMRLVVALSILAVLAACQVTTSQSLGSGVTIRHDVPLEGDLEGGPASDDPAQEGEDAGVERDSKPALTIGGGFGSGVSR